VPPTTCPAPILTPPFPPPIPCCTMEMEIIQWSVMHYDVGLRPLHRPCSQSRSCSIGFSSATQCRSRRRRHTRSCTTSTSPPLQNHSTPPLTMVTRLDGCLVDCIWASASGCGCGCICIWCSVPVLPISGGISWPERNLIMFKY